MMLAGLLTSHNECSKEDKIEICEEICAPKTVSSGQRKPTKALVKKYHQRDTA